MKEVQTATLSTTCRMKVRAILVGDAALKMIMVTGWFFFFTINCPLLNDVLFWFKLFESSSLEALNVDFLVLFCYFS